MGLLDVFRNKKEEPLVEQVSPSVRQPAVPAQQIVDEVSRSNPSQVLSSFLSRKSSKRSTKFKKHRHRKVSKHGRRFIHLVKKMKKHKIVAKRTHSRSFKVNTSVSKKKSAAEGKKHRVVGQKRELLGEALADLERELRELLSSKRSLDQRLVSVSLELEKVQAKKIRLQTQIATSLEKEGSLTKKKAATKDRVTALEQKIQKVKSIERDLKEVDS